eukprot:gene16518-56753_t
MRAVPLLMLPHTAAAAACSWIANTDYYGAHPTPAHGGVNLTRQQCCDLCKATAGCDFAGVRAHGTFDDDMGPIVTAHRTYNFTLLERLWRSQVELGLHPVVELSFMPSFLANCSWESAVAMAVNKFGLAEVQRWRFEVWNELWGMAGGVTPPCTSEPCIGGAVHPSLQVGGPNFLSQAAAINAPVDFVSTHNYPTGRRSDGSGCPQGADWAQVRRALSYWTFSDIFEENSIPRTEFHPPGWRAFQLLHAHAGSHTVPATVRSGGGQSTGGNQSVVAATATANASAAGVAQGSGRVFLSHWDNPSPPPSPTPLPIPMGWAADHATAAVTLSVTGGAAGGTAE